MGSNSGYRTLPIKAVAASAAVLSTAVMLHVSWPSIVRFASAGIPKIYGSLISWLTPPYLYFVINGIIFSIAASSRFQKSGSDDVGHIGSASGSGSAPVVKQQEYVVVSSPAQVVEEYVVPAEYGSAAVEEESNKVEEQTEKVEEEEEEFVISRSSWTPKRRETVTERETATEIRSEYSFLMEKPLVSARLGRRKSLKSSPDQAGRALGVARSKRHDTLESTWKAITDGRAVPLTRHLKKSDTWETHHHRDHHTRVSRDDPPAPEPVMRKSETFHEHGAGGGARLPPTSGSPSPLGASPAARLRKEPSVGQDDLNRRVEAFINKFNEEMRLQRQESFKHYLDMINRGSH